MDSEKAANLSDKELRKSSLIDPYPKNMKMVAKWAKYGCVKYLAQRDALAVYVLKQADEYKNKRKVLQKLQIEYYDR